MKGRDLQPHIGIFGRRNVGKSSCINALTGQDVAVVSDIPGTTTDPVRKSIELFGIGPVILIDTAGIDDTGDLGEKRLVKTMGILHKIDCAILLIADNTYGEFEENLICQFNKYTIPYFIIYNKTDKEPILNETINKIRQYTDVPVVEYSATTNHNAGIVIETLTQVIPDSAYQHTSLLKGIIGSEDVVLLITPIDSEAPEGRLILPQVMTIRDVLDNDAISVVVKETAVTTFLSKTDIKPTLAITDSQVFDKVSKLLTPDIPLTSFSIAFARLRGPFNEYIKGTKHIADLQDGDRILILESCTHQVSCDDIGRVKIPRWLTAFINKELTVDVVAGLHEITRPITDYALIIQCGGCMITRKQVFGRLSDAIEAGVPVTNYGLAIAYMNGILDRAIAPFI